MKSKQEQEKQRQRSTTFVKFRNLQRSKIESFKIRILFRTLFKNFDKKICSEYILNFLMT